MWSDSPRRIRPALLWIGAALPGLLGCELRPREPSETFDVVEAAISEIHTAMEEGRITSRELVETYVARIDAYDKRGPALNTIVTLNPRAVEQADSLDRIFEESGFVGPLHGIPVIVKDNFDTFDLPTSGGSAVLRESRPPDDAFMVARLRSAGAIVLAKSNMAEFAFSPYETVGSALPGYTRNPYGTNRVTAGSSGGTAAAVAASFGTVGMGTDTGNSIRGPSSHQALVGIRSTMGLTSRDGIIPLNLERDIAGPMARTVEDAVRVFQVVAGYDPSDSVTESVRDRAPVDYLAHLDPRGLEGKRIGIVGRLVYTETADSALVDVFDRALTELEGAGAEVVGVVEIAALDSLSGPLGCGSFRTDLEGYLASLGDAAPVRTLEEIVRARAAHSSVRNRLQNAMGGEASPEESERCRTARANTERFRAALMSVFEANSLDAVVYPTWRNPPRLIGDLQTPHGDNSQVLSPVSGFPAVTVPMGYVLDGLPVGLQILGPAWSEATLIEIAYAYEQATGHRRAPPTTPRRR